jgi:hypothetical protein
MATKDTTSKCTTIIPCTTAQKIVVDLLKGDSAIAELQLTQELLQQTEWKVAERESQIALYKQRITDYDITVRNYEEVAKNYKHITTGLESDKQGLKKTVKILGWGIAITTLTALLSFAIR